MPNAILTPSVFAKTGLALLRNKLCATKMVDTQFTDEFRKVGTTVKAKRHPEFTVTDGRVASVQDVLVGSVDVKLNRQINVSFQFTSIEDTLSVEALLKSRAMDAAIAQIATRVDSDMWKAASVATYNWAGTAGSAIDSAADFFKGPERLDLMAVPDTDRQALLNSTDGWSLASYFTGGTATSIPGSIADQAIRYAKLPPLGGMMPEMSQQVYYHTNGAWAGGALVKGASQSVSYSTESVRTTWQQALLIDDLTNATTIKVGDVFTIAGVYAINPRTKQTLSHLQQFVVRPGTDGSGGYAATTSANSNIGVVESFDGTYTFSTGGSSEMSINISPPIITSGAYQTVSAAPADDAAITLNGSASTTYAKNLCFHKMAYALCVAKPEMVYTGEAAVEVDPETGLALRYWRFSDGTNDTHSHRFDMIYGCNPLDPRLATAFSGA